MKKCWKNRIFVYGTLMSPFRINEIIGRIPKLSVATIHGYKRLNIGDKKYPIAIKHCDDKITGILMWNVTKEETQILDSYEGSEFEKELVECVVCLKEGIYRDVDAISYMYRYTGNIEKDEHVPQNLDFDIFHH